MRVVVAPDSFKGTLSASEAAAAIASGWRAGRPGDELVPRPMSDGGDGLLDAVAREGDRRVEVEVADPLGHPRAAQFLLRGRTAIVESSEACGLSQVPESRRNPSHTTTYGVGQLLDAARREGAEHVLVGLGGSATVDGGAGALAALGFRLTVADGGGLKIGGGELARIARVEPRWVGDWTAVSVELLADVRTRLLDAPARFGPQKGATREDVQRLEAGTSRWADVLERDLEVSLRHEPGTGAAGGLAFGLAAGLGARIVPGAERVAELVGLPDDLEGADLLVTGEGELDATSFEGKVVGVLAQLATERDLAVAAVVGRCLEARGGIEHVVEVPEATDAATTPGARLARAAEQLARRVG